MFTCLFLAASLGGRPALPAQLRPLSTSEILRREGPAVVLLEIRNQDGDPAGQATGVVIRSDGIVATNAHVLNGACDLRAKPVSDRPSLPIASVVSLDETRDVALLRFLTDRKLSTATIGTSRMLETGQKVIAIGNPMGLERTVSEGIVSGIRQTDDNRIIQFTAPISPGSSGGGLFDSSGRLIGITTSSLRGGQNINFAVPIEDVTVRLGVRETEWSKLATLFCGQELQEEEQDSAFLLGILGRPLLDPQVHELLKKLNNGANPTPRVSKPIPSIGDQRTYEFPRLGLSIGFTDGIAGSIHFYGGGTLTPLQEPPRTFRGRLPLGLSWSEYRSSILRRLGPPKFARSKSTDLSPWDWHMWDGYDIGSYGYSLIYTEDERLSQVWVHRK